MAAILHLPYEQADGSPIRLNTDYFGKSRAESNLTPGPFENPGSGPLSLKGWSFLPFLKSEPMQR
jgi:alpha-N-arabinofuranosidase